MRKMIDLDRFDRRLLDLVRRDNLLRWSRLPGQVCGKIKLKPMSSCREFGHQIMGGMPPMI